MNRRNTQPKKRPPKSVPKSAPKNAISLITITTKTANQKKINNLCDMCMTNVSSFSEDDTALLDQLGNATGYHTIIAPPIYWAARSGCYTTVQKILRITKQSINFQDHFGWTPLHRAYSGMGDRRTQFLRIVKLLLAEGANPIALDRIGDKPHQKARTVELKEFGQRYEKFLMPRIILNVFLTARECPNSPFFKDSFPLDLFRDILRLSQVWPTKMIAEE